MKNLFLIIINCLLLFISANAQTYYEGDFTGTEKDAAILKARDSMLVVADTTTKIAMQWELNGKLNNADSTNFRTFSDIKYLANADSTEFRTFSDLKYLENGDSTNFRTFSDLKYLVDDDTTGFRTFSDLKYLENADSTAQTVFTDLKLAGKLDDADTTSFRTFSDSKYPTKNSLNASDGDPDSALYIDATGQVGIGTISPINKLDVRGGANIYTDQDSIKFWLDDLDGGDVDGDSGITVLPNGNVGIGYVRPTSKLSFGDQHDDISNRIAFYEDNNSNYIRGIGMAKPTAGVYGVGIWAKNTATAPTNTNMEMFIQDVGNVGIGTTTPYHKLSAAASNATNVNAFNFVNTDINTNRTTATTSRDSASINGWFSGSGSPTFTVIGKGGETLFKADSSGVYGVKDTLTQPWGIMDTVTVGILPGWKVPFDLTVISVSAYTDANTVNFNIEERGAATPNTATDSIFVSSLVADNNAQDSTSFTGSAGASFAKDTWMTPRVHSCGDVAIFAITIRYVKNY